LDNILDACPDEEKVSGPASPVSRKEPAPALTGEEGEGDIRNVTWRIGNLEAHKTPNETAER